MIPKAVFLTRGVGSHKERLLSFEHALRDAGIEKFNLVPVSSILPPRCRLIDREEGLKMLSPGQIVYLVMARMDSQSEERITAGIGLAVPKNEDQIGYIAEVTSNESSETVKDRVKRLAKEMLISLGRDVDRTEAIVQSALSTKDKWTTVISAAVFVT